MAQYQRITTIEARQYAGRPLLVINDDKGEQFAQDGDYLVGCEKGKMSVIDKATFEAEYQPYSLTPTDDKLAASEALNADLHKQVDGLTSDNATLTGQVASLTAEKDALSAHLTDQTTIQVQVATLTASLAGETTRANDLQAKVDHLTSLLKAQTEAQTAFEAAQSGVAAAINS